MAIITDTVRPGDVISSDLINRMIALLNDHDTRLAGSSSGSTTNVITGFAPDPQTGQNVGRTLTIFGDFDFPLDPNTVSIDGVPIAPSAFLSGSNNTQITFIIPSSILVTGTTRPVIVRVVNSKGTAERTYTLKPQVAGAPDPTITNIVDNASQSAILTTNLPALITGLHFASPAVNNRVRLIFNPGPSQTAFPSDPGGSLAIDPANSVINPAPASSTLMVTMPQVGPPLIPTVGPPVIAHLELTALGANNPTGRDVNIARTS
jgi:hypothetical protein